MYARCVQSKVLSKNIQVILLKSLLTLSVLFTDSHTHQKKLRAARQLILVCVLNVQTHLL